MATNRSNSPSRLPALGLRALMLLFLSIIVMFVDQRGQHLETLRRGIGAAVYPLQVVVDAPARLWGWLSESTTTRDELQRENARLKAERLITNAQLQQLTALEAENARLRALLDARERVRGEVRVAEILAVDANPFRHSLIIDVGIDDGVYDGQALIDSAGIVGQVIEPGVRTSEAILISDPDHALPVEVNRNGLRTIAVGTGSIDRLDLPYLPNNADIRSGDLLVTSGLGRTFPPGFPVAVIDQVNRIPQQPFAAVSAVPTAALNQVREVMLIWAQDATPAEDVSEKNGDE